MLTQSVTPFCCHPLLHEQVFELWAPLGLHSFVKCHKQHDLSPGPILEDLHLHAFSSSTALL